MTQRFAADPTKVRRVLQTIPLRKVGRAHDVAMAVVYLASSHLAGHVSGQVLTVSGGMEGRVLYDPSEIDPSGA
jgi:3-oxoacyl-[acyl-carrier protein] reductase